MTASTSRAKAGKKQQDKIMQKYVKRSREGAKRVAHDPEVQRRLAEPDTSEHLTREEFVKRFLRD
jgi:hypothetical protein